MGGEKPLLSIRPFIKQLSSFVRARLDSTPWSKKSCVPFFEPPYFSVQLIMLLRGYPVFSG